MTITDIEQLVREACDTILTADPTLQGLCGRVTGIVIEREAFAVQTILPIVAMEIQSYVEATGRIDTVFTGVADGPDSGWKARQLVEAVVLALTTSAFKAQGLDICPLAVTRLTPLEDDRRLLRYEREAQPTINEADCLLPLLYLE
jgi:hypothetical protein